jgi:hypothetical protein
VISSIEPTDRRRFLQRGAALGGMGLLGGCVSVDVNDRPGGPAPGFRDPPRLAPMDMRPDRIMNITVCLRPFRAAGPRMDAETLGDKLVVHNYGHGGSGWSLSWGSAVRAVRTALAGGEREVAVIGCGALGLTAATVAQRAGARVTIYAKDRMPDVRSAGATGVWSPDSRIALNDAVTPGFPTLWEELTRTSFRMHQRYLGLADAPVEWGQHYFVSDIDSGRQEPRAPNPLSFARYDSRVRDLLPLSEEVAAGQHPFAARNVRRDSMLIFNITEYGRVLMNDLLIGGARIETMEFHAPAELSALKQKVVIDCTGYGARALWRDESIVPVRGQLAWLIPQPEANYGLYYRRVGVTSRRDGLIVQQTGPNDSYGYRDENEVPDRAEAEAAVATIAALFPPRRTPHG